MFHCKHRLGLRWFALFLVFGAANATPSLAGISGRSLDKNLEFVNALASDLYAGNFPFPDNLKDSLESILLKEADDSLKIKYFMVLGDFWQIARYDFEKAQHWYEKASQALKRLPSVQLELELLPKMAYNQYTLSNGEKALKYATQGVELARSEKNQRFLGIGLSRLAGIVSGYLHNDSQAIAYQTEALKIHQNLGDTLWMVKNHVNLALLKANSGAMNLAFQNLDSARMLLKVWPNKFQEADIFFWTAFFHARQSRFQDAVDNYQKAMHLFSEIGQPFRLMHIHLELGDLYQKEEQFQKTIFHGNMVLDSALFAPGLYEKGFAYRLLSKAYEKISKPELALSYLKAYHVIEDSLAKIANVRHLQELETRFQSKERNRLLLEKEQEILDSKRERRFILFGVLLLLVFIALITYALWKVRKTKRELARINEVITRQASELKSLDKLKSRFFANVSHELRTPLTLILGPLANVLKRNQLEAADKGMLQRAQTSARSLLSLINEILDLSKMEAGKLEPNMHPFELSPFLQRITAQFESHAALKKITFVLKMEIPKDFKVITDRDKLEKVLNNFLSNAFKYTSRHGKIKLIAEAKKGTVLFKVEDSGAGISPKDLPYIFDRFFQSKVEDAPAEGGTGIGLSLCKEIAGLLDAEIGADSKMGMGSTFYLKLKSHSDVSQNPIEKTEIILSSSNVATLSEDVTGPAVRELNHYGHPRRTLLIVEDNLQLQQYLKEILMPKYEVLVASNGRSALDLLTLLKKKQTPEMNGMNPKFPDLILSDVMMPEMDGFQFLNRVKEEPAFGSVPFVMLTARADFRDKLKALRTGVDDYLLKPFEEEELEARIQNLIHRFEERDRVGAAMEEDLLSDTLSKDQPFVQKLEQVVLENFRNPQLSISFIADQMEMSQRNLSRRLKKAVGIAPGVWIKEIKLMKSRELFEDHKVGSVGEAAEMVGFSDKEYFSRIFYQRFGKYPSDFFQ